MTKGRLILKCPVGGATGYTFDTYPGNALRLISDSGTVSFEARLTPREWTHVAATVDANGSSALYVNGMLVASVPRASSEVEFKMLLAKVNRVRRFYQAMVQAGNANTYEAAHARLAVQCIVAARERVMGLAAGTLPRLPARSAAAADRLYLSTTAKLCDGSTKVLDGYSNASDARQRQYHALRRAASGF